MNNFEIDIIRDSAIKLKKTDLNLSLKLMKIAQRRRENGKKINDFIYETDLEIKNKHRRIKEKLKEITEENEKVSFEKIIWFYWDSGIENAPDVVQKSYETWSHNNPDYKVILLDENKLTKILDFNISDLKVVNRKLEFGMAGYSDILRLILLYKYGGVWVDATTFCHEPLSNWLDISETGFFIFRQPKNCSDRSMVSWFMASEKNGTLIKDLLNKTLSFINYPRKKTLIVKNTIKSDLGSDLIGRDITGFDYLNQCEKNGYIPYFWMFYLWNEVAKSHSDIVKNLDKKENRYLQPNVKYINGIKVSKNTYKKNNIKEISDYRYKQAMKK